MTLVSLCSLKGAPGVTTLACLLGAAWPGPGPIVLVEADPSGGDCAARFGLSARVGWTSLSAAARRSDEPVATRPHLQDLPGGLPVLVAARGDERRAATSVEGRALWSGVPALPGGRTDDDDRLTIVDLGRLGRDDAVSDSWLAGADTALLVVRGDSASAVQARDRVARLDAVAGGRLGIVVVGGGYSGHDLEEFTGIRVLARLPFDPAAAEVATGAAGSGRRLERSPLWAAVGRLAASLAADPQSGPGPIGYSESDVQPVGVTVRRVRRARGPSDSVRNPFRAALDRLGPTVRRAGDDRRVDA